MRSLIRPGIFILFLVYVGSVLATEWPELKLTDIPKSELPVSVQVSILKVSRVQNQKDLSNLSFNSFSENTHVAKENTC